MDSGDGHSAFADSRGATLHRSGADVAGCKDSWKTRFERSGVDVCFRATLVRLRRRYQF